MSRALGRIALIAVLASGTTGLPLAVGAQEQPPTRAELVRRIDSLLAAVPNTPEYERRADSAAAVRKADYAKRHGPTSVALDTITIGPLTVVAPTEQIAEAAEVYTNAWARYERSVVDESDLALTGMLGFQISNGSFAIEGLAELPTVRARLWSTDARKESVAARLIAAGLSNLMPHDLFEWSGSLPVMGERPQAEFGLSLARPSYHERAYRSLAIQVGRSASLCFDGEIDACVRALGLDEDAGWDDLYTMSEIRALVARERDYTGEWQEIRYSCLSDRNDEACFFLMAGRMRKSSPLRKSVRASLLSYALSVGGEGAFSRLIEGEKKSTALRLEHASGRTTHDLVAAWRTRVFEARPDVTAGMPRMMVSTLFWIGLLSLMGLRSTRWRIG